MMKWKLIVVFCIFSNFAYSQSDENEAEFIKDKIWKLEHAIINGEDYFFKITDRKAPTIRMENSRLRGFSGCNSYKASYSIQGSTQISISGLTHSRMSCAEGIPTLPESYFHQAITNTFKLDVDMYHNTMTIYKDGGDYFHFVLFLEKPSK